MRHLGVPQHPYDWGYQGMPCIGSARRSNEPEMSRRLQAQFESEAPSHPTHASTRLKATIPELQGQTAAELTVRPEGFIL
jgi:hypothetical protein